MADARGQGRGRRIRWSIRTSLFGVMVLMVLAGAAGSAFLGYRVTSEAVIAEAQRRVTLDLRTAWAMYNQELDSVRSVVRTVAILQKTHDILGGKVQDLERVRARLETIRNQGDLDVLTLTDAAGRVILRTRPPYAVGDEAERDALLSRAMEDGSAAGTVIISQAALERAAPDLAAAVRLEVRSTPMAPPTDRFLLTDGMLLKAAEAVRDDEGRTLGYVLGGVLLNRNYRLADRIRDLNFQNETWDGKPVGTVTVFQGDVRIATNVRSEDGSRAVGTLLSEKVVDVTLRGGRAYDDRAWVVNDWYLSAYEPIRNPEGTVIGVLYVGVLEAKYLSYRNRLMGWFLGLTAAGMLLALALSYLVSGWLARPIRRLTEAARRVSEGDFRARVDEGRAHVTELIQLNRAFNEMADSIVREGNALMQANAAQQQANLDLARTNQQYMDMLEFVTHELKSPLSSALFATDSLREGCFGPMADAQRAVLDTMDRNLSYLNEMINNYLNLSRIEKGEMQFDARIVAMAAEVIQPVVEQVGGQVQAAQMRIECDVPDEARVVGDRELLKIVVDNLLSNAIKYGRHGTTILVRSSEEAGRLRLEVRNEGRGIPASDLPRLFQKFSRLDARELRAKKGTGLGLFITRQIVESHGGTIRAESVENEWTRFLVDLPVPAGEPAGDP